MSQISEPEAVDLLSKLQAERTPLCALFVSPSGSHARIPGFVDSVTRDKGLIISVSGSPIDVLRGYVDFFPFDRDCEFWYGEQRELPEGLRSFVVTQEESVLLFRMPKSGERLGLFFTI
jgi:hypothetical protein